MPFSWRVGEVCLHAYEFTSLPSLLQRVGHEGTETDSMCLHAMLGRRVGSYRRYQLMASKENPRVAGCWSKAAVTSWGLFSPQGGFGYNSCPRIAHKQPPRGIKCEDLVGKNGSPCVGVPPTLYDRGQFRSPRAGTVGPKPRKRRLK